MTENRSAPAFEPLDSRLLLSTSLLPDLKAAGGKSGGTTDDYGSSMAAAYNLALSSTGTTQISGKIETSTDQDFFAIVPPAAGTVSVTMTTPTAKKPLDPALIVYDANGAQVAYNNNASTTTKNAALSFTAASGAKYYVVADGFTTATGNYTITITSPTVPPPPPPPTPDLLPPAWMPAATAYVAAGAVSGQILSTASNGNVLVVVGTNLADTATVSQSDTGLILTTASGSQTFAGTFSGVAVYGFGGADKLRVAHTVTVLSVTYAGDGNDSLFAAGPAADYLFGDAGDDLLVTVGGAKDTLYGGAGLDSFWLDSTDKAADVEAAETAANTVHTIKAFYQPTSDPAQAVSLEIQGQNIVDPASGATYTDYSAKPLWVDGPEYSDIRQGALGDCYYLASLSSLASTDPMILQQMIAPLGDGTYAVRYYRSGAEVYLRIDAQLPTNFAYAKLTPDGELWVALLEKSYAQFRYGSNSYASIEGGWMDVVYAEITGKSTTAVSPSSYSTNTAALANYLLTHLQQGHAVSAGSWSADYGPIVGSHAYQVYSVQQDATGAWTVTVYNPWAVDGRTWDSNYNDGLLTISIDMFISAYSRVCVSLA